MSGVVGLSFLILILGAKGFTRGGLPFSSRTRLTGGRARAAGAACLLLGACGLALAYGASDAAERRRLATLGQGIVVGLIGASLVLVHGHLGRDADDPTDAG